MKNLNNLQILTLPAKFERLELTFHEVFFRSGLNVKLQNFINIK